MLLLLLLFKHILTTLFYHQWNLMCIMGTFFTRLATRT